MNEMKQFCYKYVTTPIAKALDYINLPKRYIINKRRKKLAEINKNDYIQTTSKLLFEQDLQEHMAKGELLNPLFLPILIAKHVDKAVQMFEEKKANGDFDELNILIS